MLKRSHRAGGVTWLGALALVALAVPSTAQSSSGLSPAEVALMSSAESGDLAAVQRLVSEGLSVDITDLDDHTPLMWAAFEGHTQIVDFLLTQGAEVDAKDVNGRSALMYASSGPFPETVTLLIERGAEVDVQGTLEGFTALMMAAAEGQFEVVRLLLSNGADPTLRDVDGDTAASFARQKGHAAVVELLQHSPPPEDPSGA